MFDLGDDLILDNFRIPWLIWIQIFVMFLLTLTILLSYFGFFALDSSSSSSYGNNSPTINSNSNSNSNTLKISSSYSSRTQAAENHDSGREILNATSNRVRRLQNNSERNASLLMKDLVPSPIAEQFFHPCRYFNLAKDAFLKCLGLGSASQYPSENEQED